MKRKGKPKFRVGQVVMVPDYDVETFVKLVKYIPHPPEYRDIGFEIFECSNGKVLNTNSMRPLTAREARGR